MRRRARPGSVSEVSHPDRSSPRCPPPRILFRLLRFPRDSFEDPGLVGRLSDQLATSFLALPLPPLHVRFDPCVRSALCSEQVHVRLPHDVPVPEGLFDLVRHFLRGRRSVFHGLRTDLPRPRFEVLQEGRFLRALPDEGRVAKDVFLLVPIEEGRHAFAPTRPEWTIETAPPTEAVLCEDPLEGLLVLRVGFPRHLEPKTHVPWCTRSRVNNISRRVTRALER